MTDFVELLFSAGGLSLVTLVFGLWIALRPGSKLARRSFLVVAVFYVCASTYGISYQFERLLVWDYQPLSAADVPPGRTAVVVLGSAAFTARDWDGGEYTVVDHEAAERAREATRIYRLIGADWITTSGGPVHLDDPDVPTGVATREALLHLGVPETHVETVTGARNTYEEAVSLLPLLRRLGADHVVLVTSGRHMRRSIGTFRAAGIAVIPAIARNTYLDRPWKDWWMPSGRGLSEASAVVHEYLGLVAYTVRGRYRF